MKAYTDLEQSKKLAEILPIESADMYYHPYPNDEDWYDIPNFGEADLKFNQLPCWSLAALLDNIPQVKLDSIMQYDKKLWRCCAYFASDWHNSDWYDNLIDACVKMIVELKEKKS